MSRSDWKQWNKGKPTHGSPIFRPKMDSKARAFMKTRLHLVALNKAIARTVLTRSERQRLIEMRAQITGSSTNSQKRTKAKPLSKQQIAFLTHALHVSAGTPRLWQGRRRHERADTVAGPQSGMSNPPRPAPQRPILDTSSVVGTLGSSTADQVPQ